MPTDILPEGSHVEFRMEDNGELLHGTILNHVPLEDGSVAYHIACYYVTNPETVTLTEYVEYARPWQPGDNTETV